MINLLTIELKIKPKTFDQLLEKSWVPKGVHNRYYCQILPDTCYRVYENLALNPIIALKPINWKNSTLKGKAARRKL